MKWLPTLYETVLLYFLNSGKLHESTYNFYLILYNNFSLTFLDFREENWAGGGLEIIVCEPPACEVSKKIEFRTENCFLTIITFEFFKKTWGRLKTIICQTVSCMEHNFFFYKIIC